MPVLIVAAIIVGVLALIGTIIVVALKAEKKRSEALQAPALPISTLAIFLE